MNEYTIKNELQGLYSDLEAATENDEQTVCLMFNTDTKDEAVQTIQDEIGFYEKQLKEIDDYKHRTVNYEKTADMPFVCW